MSEPDYIKEEYSDEVDRLRRNRVNLSYHKYGPVKKNYETGNMQAIPSMERCVKKYQDTGNTEYLLDAMNYLMFEFMYPQVKGAYFRATESHESAGYVGLSINEAKEFMERNKME